MTILSYLTLSHEHTVSIWVWDDLWQETVILSSLHTRLWPCEGRMEVCMEVKFEPVMRSDNYKSWTGPTQFQLAIDWRTGWVYTPALLATFNTKFIDCSFAPKIFLMSSSGIEVDFHWSRVFRLKTVQSPVNQLLCNSFKLYETLVNVLTMQFEIEDIIM